MRTLSFVAFGDSLTVGYQSSSTTVDYWFESKPYTDFLLRKMQESLRELGLSAILDIEIHNKGVCGDTTNDMLSRLKSDVINLRPDYVVILGGSNDIGWGVPTDTIFQNIVEMYVEVEEYDIEPITCTIPSILGYDQGIPLRLRLNELVKNYSCENGLRCVDLFTATCDRNTLRLRREYSSDGLHLSARGYELIAETIFQEAVHGILMAEKDET